MIFIKTAQEIERMRASGRAATEILSALSKLVQPGRTTKALDEAAEQFIRERGGKSPFYRYRGFPGQICVSINEEVVHGIPRNRRIQYGDIVSLDVGIILDGYVGDTAATIQVGVVDPRAAELVQVAEKALWAGIGQARDGNRVGDISWAVQSLVEKNGFSVVREFVGHGVGRKLHEDPQVPNFGNPGQGPKLKPGMTIAIEPMINAGKHEVLMLSDGWTVVTADGQPSAHVEHTVLITEDEPEILTWQEKKQFESKAP